MFEQERHTCPACGTQIRQRMQDGAELTCDGCRRRFRTMLDDVTGCVGLLPLAESVVIEPLFLPRGSIRAFVTLVIAVSTWVALLGHRDVPGFVLSLILTMMGYYFGFRKKARASGSRIYDAGSVSVEPLYLPAGAIRFILVGGSVIVGAALYVRGQLADLKYLEFAVILLGLILGYGFAKVFGRATESKAWALVCHVKGVIVVVSASCLAWMLFAGRCEETPHLALALAAVITFYFGSRS